jgi:hypothetical protein
VGGGGGGESFLRVHWVAVPKALRARRVNRVWRLAQLRPLHIAAMRGDAELAAVLLAHEPPPEVDALDAQVRRRCDALMMRRARHLLATAPQ